MSNLASQSWEFLDCEATSLMKSSFMFSCKKGVYHGQHSCNICNIKFSASSQCAGASRSPTPSFSSDFSIKRANKLPNHTSSSVFSIQRAQKLFNLTSPSEFSLQRAKKLPNLTSSSSNLPRLTVISCSTSLVEKV